MAAITSAMTKNAIGKKVGGEKFKKPLVVHRVRKQTKKKK